MTSPHGLDGSVKIADPVPALLVNGLDVLVNGETRRIERRSGTDRRPIVRLAGSSSRDDAEALRGAVLKVPRSAVPDLGPDEYWTTELVGCRVVDGSREVGEVVGVLGLPSCEALEVDAGKPKPLLVPLVGDAVRDVNIADRTIDISLGFLGEGDA